MSSISSDYSNSYYSQYLNSESTSGISAGIEASLKKGIDRVEADVKSGKIKVADFKEKLQKSFGDSVNAAFQKDGSINFDTLESILDQKLGSNPYQELGSTSNQSSSLINKASLKNRLEKEFGEDAKGIVGEDGSIDMDKLTSLIDLLLGSQLNNSQSLTANQLNNLNSTLNGSILNVKA